MKKMSLLIASIAFAGLVHAEAQCSSTKPTCCPGAAADKAVEVVAAPAAQPVVAAAPATASVTLVASAVKVEAPAACDAAKACDAEKKACDTAEACKDADKECDKGECTAPKA